jgi:hypothetical protein
MIDGDWAGNVPSCSLLSISPSCLQLELPVVFHFQFAVGTRGRAERGGSMLATLVWSRWTCTSTYSAIATTQRARLSNVPYNPESPAVVVHGRQLYVVLSSNRTPQRREATVAWCVQSMCAWLGVGGFAQLV